ncbi:MAG TPA: disulfide bond formation protein B [Albitalea sp.]|nr:disulfide bond formation protein B [Albitalea sp.]
MQASSSRRWLLAMGGLCIGAVGVALVSQHVFDMQPCPWCILQRLLFLVVALLCIVAALAGAPALRKTLAAGVLVFSAFGATAAVYQHVVAAKLNSCNLTFADKVLNTLGVEGLAPWLFQVTATCADAAVSVLGVPYEYWSLALFVLLAAASLRVLAAHR